ncbi:hypothetical protein H072_4497 [Dactylellina haptotyla CBS 200.50]|uniref:TauD/TfdA-like domain-containing protein n=1 Tax=Dactylellina haptotyla (strain CBS 200.50) TaxID=1284197 RepID=S8C1Z2_DACHA|nr:hypothetical protein H072_4497 [Dactylellina haptotyla CBS 200.50]
MEHIYQIVDCETLTAAHTSNDSTLLSNQTLLNNTDFLEIYSVKNYAALKGKIAASPVYVSPQYLDYIRDVGERLHIAITDIVSRWWSDPSLHSTIPVDPKIERILKRLDREGVTWHSGSWRPDFLIEDSVGAEYPTMKICEINARFGFNGFLGNSAIANHYYIDDESPIQPASFKFNDIFGHIFDTKKPLHIIKGREGGYDIHLLAAQLDIEVFFADRSQLRVVHTKTGTMLVHKVEGREVEISQIVLELHQDEILSLPEDILWEISIRVRINDMRTVMLVHDKRMLGLVRRELDNLVTRAIISSQASILLANSIADTCLSGTREYQQALYSETEQQWLFKPSGSGKGSGIVFKKDFSRHGEWQSFVGNAQVPHVLQRVVEHKPFNLVISDGDGSIKRVTWDLVGTFFVVDGLFSGFGPWRASSEKICALSRGGNFIMGVCDRKCLPLFTPLQPRGIRRPSCAISEHSTEVRPFTPNFIKAPSLGCGSAASHVIEVYESLEEHGVAVVQLCFSDPSSDYLVSLVRDGLHLLYGHGLPVDHSQTKGWLWDVKPVHGKIHTPSDPLARSETMHIFPWHTDCSFEASPPRYFALHVLHADRHGGGALSLIKTSDIIQELSEETIGRLCCPEFVFSVPDEFAKGSSQKLVGSLLDMSGGEPKLRFRRDIISAMTEQARSALEELDKVLDECQSSSGRSLRRTMTAEDLADGTVIIVDNAKWLHARSQVNDPDRHLRRIRWNAHPFLSLRS